MNGDPSKDSDHTIDAENMTVDEPNHIFDSVEVNTVAEENDVHGLCIQETGIQIDIKDGNIDEPNIHGSSKINDGNNEQTESIVENDVEKMMYPKILFKAYKMKLLAKDVGMENADETTNVCRETTISDLGKDLSIQGGVEMKNATPSELIWSWGRRSIAVAGEVTQHGQAHPYSWSITIVSLRSKESEG